MHAADGQGAPNSDNVHVAHQRRIANVNITASVNKAPIAGPPILYLVEMAEDRAVCGRIGDCT
jgi:hypothetical protein